MANVRPSDLPAATNVATTDFGIWNVSGTTSQIPWSVLAAKTGNVVSVKDPQFGAVGNGVTDDSAAIQAADNAVNTAGGGMLFFPKGTYLHATTITRSNNIKWIGTGPTDSVLSYTGTSDQIQVNNPINSSTAARIHTEDMGLSATTVTAGKANFADVGSTYLSFKRVRMAGADRLLILDQSELVTVEECDFEVGASSTCGVWIVNGAQHTVGANGYYTNRITIRGCQFNGSAGAGIADDGGVSHHFSDNNFNILAKQIRATACHNLVIDGASEFESPTTYGIDFEVTKIDGAAGAISNAVSVNGNKFFTVSAGVPMIQFAASSVAAFEFHGNTFDTAGAPLSSIGVTTYVNASGNIQIGGGAAPKNTLNYSNTYTPTWAGGSPSLGNGTLTGKYVRNGTIATVSIVLTAGTTTTFGGASGWSFTLPTDAAYNSTAGDYVGSVEAYDSSATTFYSGVSVGAATISAVRDGGTATFGATTPFTWASGDILRITLTYPVAPNPA